MRDVVSRWSLCQAAVMVDFVYYTGGTLDRAGGRRREEDWVRELLTQPQTRVVPVWRDQNLIIGYGGDRSMAPRGMYLEGAAGRTALEYAEVHTLLGLDGDVAVFAADLSVHEEETALALGDGGAFIDLRRCGSLLERADASLLAYARGLMHWHRRHRYCGVCGRPTVSRQGGHVRACDNADEPHLTFPRTDPAVIMVVSHDGLDGQPPACLLGRHAKWPLGTYSSLAGFVEPGESLEETVAREVFEETGVVVTDVTYRASQPWPFPASVMLGFRARALSTKITLDPEELDDARWFTADQVRAFGEWGKVAEGEQAMPRKDSIARWLIEDWLKGA